MGEGPGARAASSVFPDSHTTSQVRLGHSLYGPSEVLLHFPADLLMGNSEKMPVRKSHQRQNYSAGEMKNVGDGCSKALS